MAAIIGGFSILAGGYLTWKTFNLAQETQLTDRYTKAVDQLGSRDAVIQIGGIHALGVIARESQSFHWPVVEVLTAYVREHAPAKNGNRPQNGECAKQSYPSADIQAAMSVIGSRDLVRERLSERLNLSDTDLRGAFLEGGHFERTELHGSDLEGAKLRGVHLNKANLAGVCLCSAEIQDADFSDAKDLLQDEINGANGNAVTTLPANRCLPRNWEGVTSDTPNACPAPK